MNIIRQSDSELILREMPIIYWLNAALFAALSLLFLWNSGSHGTALALGCLSLLLAMAPSIRTVVLERQGGRVIIWRRNLFWKRRQEIPFSQIRDVEVHSPSRVKNLQVLNFVLTDDRRLTLADGSRSHGFAQTAEIMKAYLQNS